MTSGELVLVRVIVFISNRIVWTAFSIFCLDFQSRIFIDNHYGLFSVWQWQSELRPEVRVTAEGEQLFLFRTRPELTQSIRCIFLFIYNKNVVYIHLLNLYFELLQSHLTGLSLNFISRDYCYGKIVFTIHNKSVFIECISNYLVF